MKGPFFRGPMENPSSRRWWVFCGSAALFQALFVYSVTMPGKKDALTLLITAGLAVPLLFLLMLLFPIPALLSIPLLILLPAQFSLFHAFEGAFALALLAAFFRTHALRPFRLRLGPVEAVFLVFLLWGFLAVTQATSVKLALAGMKPPVMFFLAFFTGRHVLGPSRLPALLRIYAFVALGVAVELLIVMMVKGYPIALLTTHLGKLTDLGWGQSNYVAAVAALAAAVTLPMALYGEGRDRKIVVVGVLAATFVAIVTVSRGGTVALLLGVILGIAAARRNLGLAFLLIGGISAAYLVSPLGQAGIARFVRLEDLPSVGVRLLFYREALRIALEHPLLGVGPDQIPFHSYFYLDSNPHNIFLKLAADVGFVGLGLYLVLIGLLIRRWRKLRRTGHDLGHIRALSLLLLVSTALVNASYEPTLEGSHYGFLFWFLAGALYGPEPDHEISK